MIVKYKNGDTWNYIDNITHVKNDGDTYADQLLMIFDIDVKDIDTIDGVKMSEGEIKAHKVFGILDKKLFREYFNSIRCMNAIYHADMLENKPIKTIILHINSSKESFVDALITSQEAYLMNDKGQTIERLS